MLPLSRIIAAIFFVGSNGVLLANGGPWEFGVAGTGNGATGERAAKTDVTIDEERLDIDLHQEFAIVDVQYRMRNTGPAVEQPFFFPVEGWQEDLEDYRIEVDGQAIEWQPSGTAKPTPATDQDDMSPNKPARNWKRSTITFARGQSRDVRIRYRSKHAASGVSVSEDDHSSKTTFAYALSPAFHWKEPIRKRTIVIQVHTAIPEDVYVEKPNGRFKPDGPGRLKWQFSNLRPTLEDDLRIVIEPSFDSYYRPARSEDFLSTALIYVLAGSKYYLEHTDYSVSASSTLDSDKMDEYSVENLRRYFGPKSTWGTGVEGDGIGESLKLRSNRALPLAAILIMPGFRAPDFPDQWMNHNRVAEVEITLNGEHSFRVSIPNEKFQRAYPIPIRGYNKPVETLKLVITGVHRGSEDRHTFISYLALRAKLAKKPKVQGAR